jgi:hypothetical protein
VISQKFQRLQTWQGAISNAMSPAQAAELAAKAMPGDPSVVLTRDIQAKNPAAAQQPYGPEKQETAAPAARSAADTEALKWANANPSDPRAVAIKKKLGVQ